MGALQRLCYLRQMNDSLAASSGTFRLGGDIDVFRLGFGAMRITGPGTWGLPKDPDAAVSVLRRAVELGVNFIDTADSYGPHVSEELIRRALHPYAGVTVATKGGFERPGPGKWVENGSPDYLRRVAEGSLARLGVDRIDLYQLHRIDPKIPAEDQIGVLLELQAEGKIRHIGLSEVTVDQIVQVRKVANVVSVQNLFNLTERRSEDVLRYCEGEGIAFIPWFPIAVGDLAKAGGPLASVALGPVTPVQLALAWLLKRSPVMLPIPGTGSKEHLEENMRSAEVELSDELFESLSSSAQPSA